MRTLLLAALAALVAAASAHATPWRAQSLVAPSTTVGLEPTGKSGGYWVLTQAGGSADVYPIDDPATGDLLRLGPAPGAAVLAGDGQGGLFTALQREDGVAVLKDGVQAEVPGPLTLAALGTSGDALVGDPAALTLLGRHRATFAATSAPVLAAAAAVASDGTVDVATVTDGAVELFERRPNAKTTTTVLGSYAPTARDAVPAVAIATGRKRALAVLWTQPAHTDDGGVRATLFARTRADTGHLGLLQPLDDSRQPGLFPQVALTHDNRAVAAWVSAHAGGGRTPPRAVRSAFSAKGPGAFGPPLTVSGFGHVRGGGRPAVSGRDARAIDLATDDDGRVAVAWESGCRGCDTQVLVADAAPAGRLTRPRVLSGLGAGAAQPRVALDGHGGAAVAWTEPVAGAVLASTPELPVNPPRRDVRPPRATPRPLIDAAGVVRSGHFRIRTRCSEPCTVTVDLKGSTATAPRSRIADVVTDPERSRLVQADLDRRGYTIYTYTVSDRAGNVTYGRARLA